MIWFKHDSDATQDAKIKKLLIRYGPVGYAVYFHCLELIAAEVSESNLTFELEHDAEIIADDLHIRDTPDASGIETAQSVLRYIVELGLFESSGDRIYCFKLLKRMDLSMTSNPNFRKLIAAAKERHDGVMTNHDGIMTNPDAVMRASKPEEKEEEETRPRARAPDEQPEIPAHDDSRDFAKIPEVSRDFANVREPSRASLDGSRGRTFDDVRPEDGDMPAGGSVSGDVPDGEPPGVEPAYPDAPPRETGVQESSGRPESDPPYRDDGFPRHAAIATAWFRRFNALAGVTTMPDERSILAAGKLLGFLGGNLSLALKAVDFFFDHWQDFWFACTKASRNAPPESRQWDFRFASFANPDNFQEILSRMKSASPLPSEPRSWSSAAPVPPPEACVSSEDARSAIDGFRKRLGIACAKPAPVT